mmetsp:Transcript_46124/g.88012  ORF Transcript_46124/g.88012 Transcript_46124/m.88012 type:complete len:98 (-) Transcript_46124:1682-1975(-)
MLLLSAFVKNSGLCARWVPAWGTHVANSKRGNKNFFKGKGVPAIGRHTRKGHYLVVPWKIPEYVVPDLTGFALKPYISPLRLPEKPSLVPSPITLKK